MLERAVGGRVRGAGGQAAPRKAPSSTWCVPRSRCRQCGHAIRWYENIPVLSYLFLRGKCSACGTPSACAIPLVELATGALFAFCVLALGRHARGRCLVRLLGGACVALAMIDWDTTLLPDDITLPLLWAGLHRAPPCAGPACR